MHAQVGSGRGVDWWGGGVGAESWGAGEGGPANSRCSFGCLVLRSRRGSDTALPAELLGTALPMTLTTLTLCTSHRYIPAPFSIPCQVAFLVGLIYTLVGLLRLGWLFNFLSHSVISGFMGGACLTIGLSQARSAACPPACPHACLPASPPCSQLLAFTLSHASLPPRPKLTFPCAPAPSAGPLSAGAAAPPVTPLPGHPAAHLCAPPRGQVGRQQ